MTVQELIEELKRHEADREVRVVGTEEDEDDWDCWDLDVCVSEVRDGEHIELVVRPWVMDGEEEEEDDE
jgi:hypothetical protein